MTEDILCTKIAELQELVDEQKYCINKYGSILEDIRCVLQKSSWFRRLLARLVLPKKLIEDVKTHDRIRFVYGDEI